MGAIIGALWYPLRVSSYSPLMFKRSCFDFGQEQFVVEQYFSRAGALIGAAMGGATKEIKIETGQAPFDRFKEMYGLKPCVRTFLTQLINSSQTAAPVVLALQVCNNFLSSGLSLITL